MKSKSGKKTKKKEMTALSASRIDTYYDCSWKYYCIYELKLPRDFSDAMDIGSIMHSVFECLIKPRHRHIYDSIIKTESFEKCKTVSRYVRSCLKKKNIQFKNYYLIEQMVVTGLKEDFFCEGHQLLRPEYDFDIISKSPKYRIKGFMDKVAIHEDTKTLRVIDYKSSQQKFDAKKLDSNSQVCIYSLAAKKLFPKYQPVVEFLFTRFVKSPWLRSEKIYEEGLKNFEITLSVLQKIIEDFDADTATTNFACDSAETKWMCGYASTRNALKADGSKAWSCFYKFPFEYYSLCNEDGEVVASSLEKKDLVIDKTKNQCIIKGVYKGCPKFKWLHKETLN